jgi:hypothetical protein
MLSEYEPRNYRSGDSIIKHKSSNVPYGRVAYTPKSLTFTKLLLKSYLL